MSLTLKKVDRPRELKWYQASSMLYGDWGTSKAYVLGLAFAIAGHASMFFLIAMAGLTALIGFCYIIVCKAYPDGGGVYSAVKNRSKTLAVIGALLLVADYVVTAALSSIEAFHYLGFSYPAVWAIGALVLIGLINIVGPSKSSQVAAMIAIPTVICLVILCVVALPQISHIQITAPRGNFFSNWASFVGIVLALSGVEAIANVTGIMVEPVKQTAKRAILPVLFEVIVVSLILGAAMNAIPNLSGHTEDMIKYIGEFYIGTWYGKLIGILLGLLLLSACNTAIMGLISILFLMSKDKELPQIFSKLNRFGMPWFGLLVATVVPILVLMFEHDVTHLAALYAIGVVGAIAINLGACCVNPLLGIKKYERTILGISATIMIVVELTIIYEKRNAVIFAAIILLVGLTTRFIAKRFAQPELHMDMEVLGINVLSLEEARDLAPLYRGSTLVALKTVSPNLIDEAVLHAKGKGDAVVYALYVDEKPPGWAYPTEMEPSLYGVRVLVSALRQFEEHGITALPIWSLSHDPGAEIVKAAVDLHASTVMIGTTKRGAFERLMKSEVLKTIAAKLPQEKHLLICN